MIVLRIALIIMSLAAVFFVHPADTSFALTITSVDPYPGATSVAPDSPVTITWSAAIDCSTVTIGSVTIRPRTGLSWTMTSCSNNAATFAPGGQAGSTTYAVSVTTTVRDMAGDSMAANYLSTYVTSSKQVLCTDRDGDGYGDPGNIACPKGPAADCNDYVSSINPGALDSTCNGLDENCNGIADEGFVPAMTTCGTGACVTSGQNVCRHGTVVNTCTPLSEGPYSNAMCSDGHDNDCDGKIDLADPGCAAPLAGPVTLMWLAPVTDIYGVQLTDLEGFKIFYGQQSQNYSHVMDISNTTSYTLSGLTQGTWCFAVKAYDTSGNESGYSNEVCKYIN